MSDGPRVLVLSTSAKNPFLEAWIASIKASGATTVALVDARRTGETSVPGILEPDTELLTEAGPLDWRERVMAKMSGAPEVVFDWWGMAALARRVVSDAWPGVPRVLCVDTYPNASRIRAEARDYAQANALLGRAAGLVVQSRAMRATVDRTTGGRWRGLPSAVVYSPFPLSAHYRGERVAREPGPIRLCFTGRSDYLFSDESGMSKDAVGEYLAGFIRHGAEVHVMHPGSEQAATALLDRGFQFYEDVPRDEIVRGGLAEVISGFDGHLVVYAQPNGTVHRRVANSLSTRFATAVCAPAPIVVPASARFVDELFDEHPIGFRADDVEEVLARIGADGESMTDAWFSGHRSWAGEASTDDLARLWAVARRS